jgi:hypothetical protein
MKSILFALIFACVMRATLARAQEIRIVVLDAGNLKPVADECLNISLGLWHGTDIIAPTDSDGAVVLTIGNNEVVAKPVVGKTCNGMASTKPVQSESVPTTISVLSDWYVSCQYSKKLTKDPAWLHASPSERIPSFSVKEILGTGVVATNSCSRRNPTPKPGELFFLVRKRTFLEGMKS